MLRKPVNIDQKRQRDVRGHNDTEDLSSTVSRVSRIGLGLVEVRPSGRARIRDPRTDSLPTIHVGDELTGFQGGTKWKVLPF